MVREQLWVAFQRLLIERGSSAAIVSLGALAIVAFTSTFAIAYALLWRPLPYPDHDRLVAVSLYSKRMATELGWPAPMLVNAGLERFEAFASYKLSDVLVGDDDRNEIGTFRSISTDPALIEMLGVVVLHGRSLVAEDAELGAEPVALLDEGVATKSYGDAKLAVGRHVTMSGARHRIVGIVPSTSAFPTRDVKVWTPRYVSEADKAITNAGSFGGTALIARLAANQDLPFAESQTLASLEREPVLARLINDISLTVSVLPVRSVWSSGRQHSLASMLVAAFLMLVIATANTASLFVIRQMRRRQEHALLDVFGSGVSHRLFRLAAEALVLMSASVVLASILVPFAVSAMRAMNMFPREFPHQVGLNLVVVLVAVSIAFALVGVLLGTGWATLKQNPIETLQRRGAGQASSSGTRTARLALLIGQLSLTLAFVYGTALLILSSKNLENQNLGFSRSDVLIGTIEAAPSYEGDDAKSQLLNWYASIYRESSARPIALATSAPFSENVAVEATSLGASGTIDGDPDIKVYSVFTTPNYFQVLGIPITAGRSFTSAEAENSSPVAIVDQAFAATNFKDGDSVGRTISLPDADGVKRAHTIVGVVGQARQRSLAGPDEYPTVYRASSLPFMLPVFPANSVEIAVEGSPAVTASVLRDSVSRDFPGIRFSELRPLSERVRESIGDRARLNRILGALGIVAIILCCIGIYSVISEFVLARVREIGVRKALGQSDQSVFWMIVKEASLIIAMSVTAALPISLLVGASLSDRLYGVGVVSTEAVTILLVGVAIVGFASCVIPANRAKKLSPATALRYE